MFEDDFLLALRTWRSQGERLLIFGDANEHILDGKYTRRLLEDPLLGLVEETSRHWGDSPPNTHVMGSVPIDGVWRTPDIEVNNLIMLPFSHSVGDHRTIILDVTTLSMIGSYQHKVVYPPCRPLSNKHKQSVARYVSQLERQMDIHRVEDRLSLLEASMTSYPASPEQQIAAEHLDTQFVELQRCSEKRCRKITKTDLPHSLPVKYWVMRRRSYMELIKCRHGKVRNVGNVMNRARKNGIEHPRSLTLSQLEDGVALCKHRMHELRKSARGLRRVHLRDCLIRAQDLGNEQKAKGILQIIQREEGRRMWFFINRVTDDPRPGGCLRVERYVDGVLQSYSTQEGMVGCIQEETEYRFLLAHSAPITATSLADKLGYLTDEEVARDLFTGNLPIPDDVDDVTALVISEISRLGLEFSSGSGESITISPEEFRRYWRKARERTSSSLSTIHFGHYIAATTSDKITAFLSKKITVIARSGCPPSRWSCGLQVMLEKVAGVALVNKLRAILLMEADYNFHNKWVFGHQALNFLLESGYVPEDQYSQRESTAEDAKMDSRLTADLSRQLRLPMGSVSADASNCYDRINHIIMSLLLFAITGWIGAIAALLAPIQSMKFFQRTGLGDSTTFMGGPDLPRVLQGLCQGNGAAPACWTMLSAVLMHCYRLEGFGARLLSPISRLLIEFMGTIFVDDTDLVIMDPTLKSSIAVYEEMQRSLYMWGDLLTSTGGALKPEKCFWYLVDYEFKDGEWIYTDTVDWELLVPLPDGSEEPIQQYDVHHCEKTLGVWSSPSGEEGSQLEKIAERVEKWTSRTANGHLPAKFAWVSYKLKLWPGLRYGLATLATPFRTAASFLDSFHFRMLPFLGINRNIKREWRTLPRAFGGIGLFSFPVEQTICCLNMLLQHYGVPSTLGKKFQASLECLQLEVGVNVNPLTISYDIYGSLATTCWVKTLWERLWVYRFQVTMDYPDIPFPREKDALMVDLFRSAGWKGEELRSLNRVRLHLQMLFLSDIVLANGRQVDASCLRPHAVPSTSSSYDFPREEPTSTDWTRWADFWTSFTQYNFLLSDPLGDWIAPTHRSWLWHYDVDNDVIQLQTPTGVDFYHLTPGRARTRSEQIYIYLRSEPGATAVGRPVSVSQLTATSIRYLGFGPPLVSGPSRPADFWTFLRSWGGTWMWEGVEEENQDLRWLVEGIRNGTVIAVADGSYDRKTAPDVSGAGLVLCCTNAEKMLRVSFFERSRSASSYRGELLGLVAIHLLLLAMCQFYEISVTRPKVCCDNIGALKQARNRRRRIKTGASQADILRVLRTVTSHHTHLKPVYEHVSGHQDRYKPWWRLTLAEQLNCVCDGLAKAAVFRSIQQLGSRKEPFILPLERAAVFVSGVKQTSDVSRSVRFCLGEVEARAFYTAPPDITERNSNKGGLGWSQDRFNQVAWSALDAVLASKPDMYGVWLSKQSSGFCATGSQMARVHASRENRCPNCGLVERAAHLNVCPSVVRTRLLTEGTELLENWLYQDGRTDGELAYWLIKYILFRGTQPMASLGPMSSTMHRAALSQDAIGWREFMEGKVSKEIAAIQDAHCATSPCRMNGSDWMKHFISHLLHLSHSQWICRNITLHDKLRGTLFLRKREDVLKELDSLIETDPEELPAERRFLLEFDFDSLYRSSFENQTYWVRAIKAARRAGQLAAARRGRMGASARRVAARRRSFRPCLDTSAVTRQLQADLGICSQAPISNRRPASFVFSSASDNPCNKRLRKPD